MTDELLRPEVEAIRQLELFEENRNVIRMRVTLFATIETIRFAFDLPPRPADPNQLRLPGL